MKINFLLIFISISILAITACESNIKYDKGAVYNPVNIENALICETADDYDLLPMQLVDTIISCNFNVICLKRPNKNELDAFKKLVDSCHEQGLTVMLHAASLHPDDIHLVRRLDVDGFHYLSSTTASDVEWASHLDSLYSLKNLLIITDSLNESLYYAGFGAFRSTVLESGLREVITNGKPLAVLDSAIKFERYSYPSETQLIRNTDNFYEDLELNQGISVGVIHYAVGGIPITGVKFLKTHASFIREFNGIYNTSPALQYGSVESMVRQSEGVLVLERVYGEDRVLAAVNLRDTLLTYSWPPGLSRSNTRLLGGDPIATGGGQALKPFHYQLLEFKYLDGMQPLELDNKK